MAGWTRIAVMILLTLGLGIGGVRAQSMIRAVALAGDPAPGGGTFEHFGVEALPIVAPVNTKGQVAFFATLLRSTASEAFFLAGKSRTIRVVAEGDRAPAGGTFAGFGPPVIDNRRRVAFAAVIEGRAVPGGVFVADGASVRMLTGAGNETPIGGIFARFSERVALNDAGAVAFTAG